MSQSETIDLLANALCKAQSGMTAAVVNKTNPHFRSKYADLASVVEAIRKPLTDNGLAITQTTEQGPDHFYLSTTLLHTSGQWLRSEYPLPMNATPQAMGSALTYARRYSLSAIAGIAADEDDDGAAATRKKTEPSLEETKRIAPHEIALPDKPRASDWIEFGQSLLEAINGAANDAEARAWKEANRRRLDQMTDKEFPFPKTAERLDLALQKIGPKHE